MKNQDLKKLIKTAYEAAGAMYETPYGQYFAQKGISSFQIYLEHDLIKYVSYLANVKGIASEREVVLFKDCYRDPYSNIGIYQAQKALDSNLEGDDFESTIPFLLSAYLLIDIEMCNNGLDPKGTASRLYIDLFQSVGWFFVEYHGRTDFNEESAMCEYIEFLETARDNKLKNIVADKYLTFGEDDEAESSDYGIQASVGRKTSENERKKDVLLKSFDIIKDDYENSKSMADVVNKMFEIDFETAIDMWTYLLTVYESQAAGYSYDLTGAIIWGGAQVIGQDKMDNLILSNPVLKQVLIRKKRLITHSGIDDLIKRKIERNELQVADEILQAIYNTPDKFNSWYEIMRAIMPYKVHITDEAQEFLEMWCDRVENAEQRAKLSIQMIEYLI